MSIVVGYDIGVNSVGYTIIRKQENCQPEILKIGTRIVPEDKNFHKNFYEGKTASKNAERTEKRGIRRNNQRFKQRRDKLYAVLRENKMFPSDQLMYELPPLDLYRLRAQAVERELSLEELGRVLIMLNQRRGFDSNKKFSTAENMSEYKEQVNQNEEEKGDLTIGQQLFEDLRQNLHSPIRGRTYLRSSYKEEFDRIWDYQQQYHSELLGDKSKGSLYHTIRNRIIYYQRDLKSQKHLISECRFEKNRKVAPQSSPYNQLRRIYEEVNNFEIRWIETGDIELLTPRRREELIHHLLDPESNCITGTGRMTKTRLLKFLGYDETDVVLNYNEFQTHQSIFRLYNVLDKAEVDDPKSILKIDEFIESVEQDNFTDSDLYQLWHKTYSITKIDALKRTLEQNFELSDSQAEEIAESIDYPKNYARLSVKAMRKIMPHLIEGKKYSEACDEVGYDHSGYKTDNPLLDRLPQLEPNSLKNPVVEQILNQVINLTNLIMDRYGRPDEIRVELARSLKNSYKQRKRIHDLNKSREKQRSKYREKLRDEYNKAVVNLRDLQRFELYEETNHRCLYCADHISKEDFLNGNAEQEHIIPRSRSFNDSMQNKILAHRKCNDDKGQRTAFDFMQGKSESDFQQYVRLVESLYDGGSGSISWVKYNNLLKPGDELEGNFVGRQIKDTQYISRKSLEILAKVAPKVFPTTGSITSFLRTRWQLNHLLQDIVLPKFEQIDKTRTIQRKDSDGNTTEKVVPDDWSKRDDNRHHAIDALIVALTNPGIVFALNNLNKRYQYRNSNMSEKEREELVEQLKEDNPQLEYFDLNAFIESENGYRDFPVPIDDLRNELRPHLEKMLISYKKSSKALSKSMNYIKGVDEPQETLVPRGALHKDTKRRKVKIKEWVQVRPGFDGTEEIVSPVIKSKMERHLEKFDDNPKAAFKKANIRKENLSHKGELIEEVKVWGHQFVKTVELKEGLSSTQYKNIFDDDIRTLVEEYVETYDGDVKEAFKNYLDDPIYLDRTKGVILKRVSVKDNRAFQALRECRDHKGELVLKDDSPVPAEFVITRNNHHALIYKDREGAYQDKVKTLWEVVTEGKIDYEQDGSFQPSIKRKDIPDKGWKFQFSIQIGDLFVIGLDMEADAYFEKENREVISEHLFRVQNVSSEYYEFKHHLESQFNDSESALKGKTWERIQTLSHMKKLTKVHLNALGEIVKVGE